MRFKFCPWLLRALYWVALALFGWSTSTFILLRTSKEDLAGSVVGIVGLMSGAVGAVVLACAVVFFAPLDRTRSRWGFLPAVAGSGLAMLYVLTGGLFRPWAFWFISAFLVALSLPTALLWQTRALEGLRGDFQGSFTLHKPKMATRKDFPFFVLAAACLRFGFSYMFLAFLVFRTSLDVLVVFLAGRPADFRLAHFCSSESMWICASKPRRIWSVGVF